jgi:MFS family permease
MTSGMKWAFVLSGLLCILALFLLKNFSSDQEGYAPLSYFAIWRKMNPGLKRLLFSDILIRFCEQIPHVFVVLWCMNIVGTTATEFGILTAIEMIVATLIYIPVARYSDKMERKPFVIITFIFLTVFPILLYFSRSWGMLLIAFVIKGLKEFGEPTRKAMIMDLSPDHARARSVGVYYFIRDGLAAFAALLGGWLWHLNPDINLWVAAGFGTIGTIAFAFFGRTVSSKHR